MSDMREFPVAEPEVSSNRSKILGAAVVALGLGALGAYSFASGDMAKPASQQMATNQVRTTPEYGGQTMLPPVTPVPVEQKPVIPQSDKPKAEKKVEKPKTDDTSQQAVVSPKEPMAPPSPIQTPPENAAPPPAETAPADQQQTPPPDQPQPQ